MLRHGRGSAGRFVVQEKSLPPWAMLLETLILSILLFFGFALPREIDSAGLDSDSDSDSESEVFGVQTTVIGVAEEVLLPAGRALSSRFPRGSSLSSFLFSTSSPSPLSSTSSSSSSTPFFFTLSMHCLTFLPRWQMRKVTMAVKITEMVTKTKTKTKLWSTFSWIQQRR